MPQRLPFEAPEQTDVHNGGTSVQCPLHNLLSPELRDRAEQSPHLMNYLHRVPMAEYGVPEFFPEINRKMGDMKDPNLIYPVNGDTYVHIFPDAADARNWYIAIEPASDRIGDLMEQIEVKLLDFVEVLAEAETPEQKTVVLLQCIENSCEIVDGPMPVPGSGDGKGKKQMKEKKLPKVRDGEGGFLKLPFGGGGGSGGGAIKVSQADFDNLRYMVIRDKVGMGPLEPLISDNWIEDISCSGLGAVYIEHKIFKGLKSNQLRYARGTR
jgi:flagellar protein FlaI